MLERLATEELDVLLNVLAKLVLRLLLLFPQAVRVRGQLHRKILTY